MEQDTATLKLDYGGFTDSAGKKVSVWSVTALSASRKQVHFDFFFDQADKKMKGAGKSKKDGKAKKDGQTGIYFLREFLDLNRSATENGVSMLQGAFPGIKHLIFSGDTGNGFRAYAMLDELSCVYEKYGYTVELSPLAPGHAWNRTDARIAHMNTFLRLLKARSRVFGAIGVVLPQPTRSTFSLCNSIYQARPGPHSGRYTAGTSTLPPQFATCTHAWGCWDVVDRGVRGLAQIQVCGPCRQQRL